MASRPETSSNVEEVIKKDLFDSAMQEVWEKVINIYLLHPELHQEMITRSGDTALHVAISNGEEGTVEKLVEKISRTSAEARTKTLRVKNERGDTPLHLAAAMGSVRICRCIAEIDPELIGARNCDQETPLYVAVLNGNKDAFYCLQKFIGPEKGLSYCRGKDGDTILTSAINGFHFDLAFQIIHIYPKLVDYVNQNGMSPLHILASKPSAFESGSRLGWYQKTIYKFTFVDELRVQTVERMDSLSQLKTEERRKGPNYPENYSTCIDFFGRFRIVFRALFGGGSNSKDTKSQAQGYRQILPPNYGTCFEFVKLALKAMLIILGFGSRAIRKVEERKERHKWSLKLTDELLKHSSSYEYQNDGGKPQDREDKNEDVTMNIPSEANEDGQKEEYGNKEIIAAINSLAHKMENMNKPSSRSTHAINNMSETAILMAARNGITEMVEKILEKFPVAIHDVNSEKKNVVLLAVENRQPHVYKLLREKKAAKDSIFRKVDVDGNSALHLAATLGDYRPWKIPGAALQMQWEIKWYEYVKDSMPPHFFARYNNKGHTAKDIFKETHKDLIENGGKWLTSTSESCSVVAALIATVAFATSSTVPGGLNDTNGEPILQNEPAFDIFAISSLVTLCFSVTSLVMFLSILTSRHQEKDFRRYLPRKLLVGLTSLFVSIASVLLSFCAGHFFVLKDKLKFTAFPLYAVTCLPVTFFAIAQFPLYLDLIRATLRTVPQRCYHHEWN